MGENVGKRESSGTLVEPRIGAIERPIKAVSLATLGSLFPSVPNVALFAGAVSSFSEG